MSPFPPDQWSPDPDAKWPIKHRADLPAGMSEQNRLTQRIADEQAALADVPWDLLPAVIHEPELCSICDAVRAEIERRTRPA
jgi:hypothetical protein